MTATDFDCVGALADVAVTLAVIAVLALAGAVNLLGAPLTVLFCAIDPQALNPTGHVIVQLTP